MSAAIAETVARALANRIPLTRADCVVRAARGHENKDGGIVWSGVLWIRDEPVANFHNDGNGGCNLWTVRNAQTFDEFKALAVREMLEYRFEQEDHLIGKLWDAAILRGVA